MRRSRTPLLLALAAALCLLAPPPAHARRQETGFLNRTIAVNGVEYRYVVYLPRDWTHKRTWPVILFLHGSGERGADGLDQTQIGLPAAVRAHPERWPFVIVMPQIAYHHHYWTDPDMMAMAMAALKAEVKEFHGDPDRLYLTGLSLGGYGVWEIAKTWPGRFAALAPVASGIYWSYAPERRREPGLAAGYAKAIGRTPVWMFHGANDRIISPDQSRTLFEALRQNGGDVRLWTFAGTGHNAWNKAYGNPALPQWLLAHTLPQIAQAKPFAEEKLIPIHPVPLRLDPAVYDAYLGQYADRGVVQMTIFRTGTSLMVKNRTGQVAELFPETPTRFFYASGSTTRVNFKKDAAGRVTGILYHDDRHEEFWPRVK